MLKAAVLGIALIPGAALDPSRLSLAAEAAAVYRHPDLHQPKRAHFHGEQASPQVRHVADWAVHSGDHDGRPFIVIDKVDAKLFAFDSTGGLIRATPVLLGMGVGDKFAPGVIDLDMYATQPWQRITPAGRYLAEEDLNLKGERILWMDYDAAIAIHKLPARRTKQRRQERLASATPADNRITYGCINVPVAFYHDIISRYFGNGGGVVYIRRKRGRLRQSSARMTFPAARSLVRLSRLAT